MSKAIRYAHIGLKFRALAADSQQQMNIVNTSGYASFVSKPPHIAHRRRALVAKQRCATIDFGNAPIKIIATPTMLRRKYSRRSMHALRRRL